MKIKQKSKEINIDVNNSLDILLKKLDDMQSELDETKKLLNAVSTVVIYNALDDIRSQEHRIESKLDMILDRGSMDRDDIQVTFRRAIR